MIAVFDHPAVFFDNFIASYPDRSHYHYELRRGTIVPMPKPKGKHFDRAIAFNPPPSPTSS